ncbi:MAG: 30S ribosomal protein S13, partial [Armatimonadia bacterium]
MPRIVGVDVPRDKRVGIALTYIYGIGHTTAKKIVEMAGIDPATRMRDVTEDEAAKLREIIERDYT